MRLIIALLSSGAATALSATTARPSASARTNLLQVLADVVPSDRFSAPPDGAKRIEAQRRHDFRGAFRGAFRSLSGENTPGVSLISRKQLISFEVRLIWLIASLGIVDFIRV